jgi:hypothetical protein
MHGYANTQAGTDMFSLRSGRAVIAASFPFLAMLFVSITAMTAMMACGDISSIDEDTDNKQAKALLLPPNMLVKDSVNAEEGDATDWRDFTVFVESEVVITYVIGGMGAEHDVVGDVTCFDMKSKEVAGEPVSPETQTYELRFTAKGKQHYFCRLRAKQGASAYAINSETTAVVRDPCAACSDEEKCIDEECVPKDACVPACSNGQVCSSGSCECSRGMKWSRSRGKCIKSRRGTKARPPCGGCAGGMVCDRATDSCVKAAVTPKPRKKSKARVLSAVPAGSKGAILTINRGARHGIKAKMTGTLANGASVEVIEVFPFRCRARTRLPASSVKPDMAVSF